MRISKSLLKAAKQCEKWQQEFGCEVDVSSYFWASLQKVKGRGRARDFLYAYTFTDLDIATDLNADYKILALYFAATIAKDAGL